MNVQKAFLLTMVAIFVTVAETAQINFTNNCPFPVWPATQTGGGSPQLPITGLVITPNSTDFVQVPASWSNGRLWGRTGATVNDTNLISFLTGDCGSGQTECNGSGPTLPVTLMEFDLNGPGGLDSFNINIVNGFNLPVSIMPVGGVGVCFAANCARSINRVCPPELAVKNSKGRTVACKSACLAFNRPEHCCNGTYDSPVTCPPTKYTKLFKDTCPQARSYVYDDSASTFTCPTGKDYLITFCP